MKIYYLLSLSTIILHIIIMNDACATTYIPTCLLCVVYAVATISSIESQSAASVTVMSSCCCPD